MVKARFQFFLLTILLIPVASALAAEDDITPGLNIVGGGDVTLKRISESESGHAGNQDSFGPSVSADGRYIAFQSAADNLVPGDTNGVQDIFVHDLETHHVVRLTVNESGAEANGPSRRPVISADGQVVAFESQATNLVAADTDDEWDIYRVERSTLAISLVSAGLDGAMSNGRAQHPAISGNGQLVAFAADADNLVPNDTNQMPDVFLYNALRNEMVRVSVSSAGEEGNGVSMHPAIAVDGGLVAFQSLATNLAGQPDGNAFQIFFHEPASGHTKLVTMGIDGVPGNMESQRPALSANGRFMAFESWADNLVSRDINRVSDVFVYDRWEETFTLVSISWQGQQANHVNGSAVISGNGRYVAFASLADNLVTGDHNYAYDVFLHDRELERTALVSVSRERTVGNGASISPAVSATGKRIVFDSMASNLVVGDDNQRADVFILDQLPQFTESVYLPRVSR